MVSFAKLIKNLFHFFLFIASRDANLEVARELLKQNVDDECK